MHRFRDPDYAALTLRLRDARRFRRLWMRTTMKSRRTRTRLAIRFSRGPPSRRGSWLRSTRRNRPVDHGRGATLTQLCVVADCVAETVLGEAIWANRAPLGSSVRCGIAEGAEERADTLDKVIAEDTTAVAATTITKTATTTSTTSLLMIVMTMTTTIKKTTTGKRRESRQRLWRPVRWSAAALLAHRRG